MPKVESLLDREPPHIPVAPLKHIRVMLTAPSEEQSQLNPSEAAFSCMRLVIRGGKHPTTERTMSVGHVSWRLRDARRRTCDGRVPLSQTQTPPDNDLHGDRRIICPRTLREEHQDWSLTACRWSMWS